MSTINRRGVRRQAATFHEADLGMRRVFATHRQSCCWGRAGDAGRFLLLGSTSLDLMRQAGESLAGRVSYMERAGIGVCELPPNGPSVETLWVRGGFPRSLLARSTRQSLDWRRDFVRRNLESARGVRAGRRPACGPPR